MGEGVQTPGGIDPVQASGMGGQEGEASLPMEEDEAVDRDKEAEAEADGRRAAARKRGRVNSSGSTVDGGDEREDCEAGGGPIGGLRGRRRRRGA